MKKIALTAFALCATTLLADESFGGIGLVIQDGKQQIGSKVNREFGKHIKTL